VQDPAATGDSVIDGRYRVISRLGAGSMGVVYRAEDVFLGRTVAIKVVDPAHGEDEETRGRFLKEARALAQIRHDNVVQVFAFGPHGDSFYFAMEYVPGRNLDDVLEELNARSETMELAQAMPIIRQIARGLGAVHQRGLVHRDVKPGNIVIEDGSGRPVLVDFGLARNRSAGAKVSMIAGTPMYMAPEQATDPDGTRVTYRADIYALAGTVFELLTGRPMFDFDDPIQAMSAHLKMDPIAISSKRAELAAFDAPLLRALAKDPARRHESCDALLADLEAAAKKTERAWKSFPIEAKSAKRVARLARVVLFTDDAVARGVERNLEKVLRDKGIMPVFERAASASEAFDAAHAPDVWLLVFDDDNVGDTAASVLGQLATLPRTKALEIVAVARDLADARTRLAPLGVKEILPKPMNAHVLGSVLGRVANRIG
jgi:eukaryotic-like serine/threonine-protein kinase